MIFNLPTTLRVAVPVMVIAAALMTITPKPLTAQDTDFGQLVAEAVPVDVNEVVTGGSWQEGDKEGVFRAISVLVPRGETYATEVFVQWVAFPADGSEPEIVSTIAVKQVNDAGLSDATISLDGENANEVLVTVAAYDQATDKDLVFGVKATAPGKYEMFDIPAQ